MSMFKLTVPAHTIAVEYRHGAISRVLGPGRHPRRWKAQLVRLDTRESLLPVAPQDVLTTDGITVKVTAAVRWAVADAVTWVQRTTDPLAAVYLATQVAIRDALSALTCDELARRGATLPVAELLAAVVAVGREVGVDVREVVVKDVILESKSRTLEKR